MINLLALSASKLKIFDSCSWVYYSNYHLHIPQNQNDGARMGGCVHNILELLIKPKHHKYVEKLVKAKTIVGSSIEKLVRHYAKKEELVLTQENLLKIDQMLLVALNTEFILENAKFIEAELKFDIKNEDPIYYIKGFMDKTWMRGDEVIIDDYKSSKVKFKGSDSESNLQSLVYSLAALKLWPGKKPRVRFIFLQHPKDPIMECTFSEDALAGFEYYLEEVQKKVNNFTEKDAKKGLAYNKGMPKDGSFSGMLMCGRAKFPGELKKDGINPQYFCPYKFPFEYYIVKKDGQFKYSTKKIDVVLKEGETIEKAHYGGCPAFNTVKRSVIDDF